MNPHILVLISFLAFGSFVSAQESTTWKCEEDSRSNGGVYESVSLQKSGSLHRLLFSYVPSSKNSNALPAIESKTLIDNLHCRFYAGKSSVVQCVSTNFKKFISSELVMDETGANTQKVQISIQSDLLVWPSEYSGLKKDGTEEFTVNLNSETAFCGFPQPL